MNIKEHTSKELNKLSNKEKHSLERLRESFYASEHSSEAFDEISKIQEQYAKNKQKVENIANLIDKSKNYIDPNKEEEWEEAVFSLTEDLSYFTEVESAVNLMEAMNNSADYSELNSKISSNCDRQFVDRLISKFSAKGHEYYNFINNEYETETVEVIA